MPTYQTYTVPKIGNQTPASNEAAVALIDNSLTYIDTALNSMSMRLSDTGSKNAIIRHDVPVGPTVDAGTLVYFNRDTSRFEPALAELEAMPGEQGQSLESPRARVEGLILRVDISQATGTLLCGGYYEDTDVARNCLGDNALSGTYYLSPTNPGRATTDTNGLLRQPVLSYYGYGKLSLALFYLAHDNHFHTTAILDSGWEAAGSDAPAGAILEYDVPTLLANQFIGEIAPDTTAVFWNGILQPVSGVAFSTGPFAIKNGKLYCSNVTAPVAGSVTLFNHFPFAYNSSVVRSVVSTNDELLKAENNNGIITLTPYEFVGGSPSPSSMAVASVVGGTVSYTPVVSGISGGPGVNVTKDLNGIVTLSLSSMVGDQIDAWSIQHNGSVLTSDGILQFITFPANRESEFVMFLPVTEVPEGTVLQASAWGTLNGQSTTLHVSGYFIPQPTADHTVTLPNTNAIASANDDPLNFNGSLGQLSYAEVELTGCTISSPGMLVAVVSPTGVPVDDIQLFRVGFKLSVLSSSNNTATDVTDYNGMVTGELTAAESIAIGQAVYINGSGRLAVCKAGNSAHAGRCVGIAFNSAAAGSPVTYIISGITSAGVNNLTTGAPVYINTNGTLLSMSTTVAIEAFYTNNAFLQRVGTAVSSNLVQVHIEPTITGD